jgi:hypothetical protein
MFNSTNIKSADTIIAEQLAQAKAAKIAQINAERDVNIAAGVTYDGNEYQTDEASIADLAQATQMATINNASSVQWLTEDNTVVTLTFVKLKALANAVFTLKTTEIYAARLRKDAVNAATTIAQVKGV